MIWGLLCFQSPGWSTQLPVTFALCGCLGSFPPPNFSLPHWLQSKILKICSSWKCSLLLRAVSAGRDFQGRSRGVWEGRKTENQDVVWAGAVLRRELAKFVFVEIKLASLEEKPGRVGSVLEWTASLSDLTSVVLTLCSVQDSPSELAPVTGKTKSCGQVSNAVLEGSA